MRSLCPSHTLEGHRGVVLAAELNDSATTAYTGAGDGVSPCSSSHTGAIWCVCVVGESVGGGEWSVCEGGRAER